LGILPDVGDRGLSQLGITVPFVDLGVVHQDLKEAVLEAVGDLIERADFTNGAAVVDFEHAFAAYCGARHCVGMSSGLDALRLALIAGGLQAGDEVIVPAFTFAATFEAVTQAGGIPVVVDVSEADYNLDVTAAESAVGDRTRFVLPVHLYGQMSDMRALLALAESHDLQIIEDACQAHGAVRDGIAAGTRCLAGAFSFYPAKNLGAMGDAGALTTGDEGLAERARALREHGQYVKYEHVREGYTARLDTIQALVLLRKLTFLSDWNEERRAVARSYSQALNGVGDLRLPPVPPRSEPVWYVYVIRTAEPRRLADFLRERGVGTARHYPQPPHLSPAFAELGYAVGAFPLAERLAEEVLSLPIYPKIGEVQVSAVVEAIREYFRSGEHGKQRQAY
jgi:dTDP-3-amino-3,4,6-trideoxy-alpha-D-glucose transaminase